MNNFTQYLKNTGYLDTTNGNDGSVSTTNTWTGDGQSPMNVDSQLSDAMDVANRYDAGKADRAETRRNIEYLRDAYKDGSNDPNLSNYGERDDQVDSQLQRDYEDSIAQQNAKNIQGANAYTGGIAGQVIGAGVNATTGFLTGKAGAKSTLGKLAGTGAAAETVADGAKMAKASDLAAKTGATLDEAAGTVNAGSKLGAAGLAAAGTVIGSKVGWDAGQAIGTKLREYSDDHPENKTLNVLRSGAQKVVKTEDKVKDTLSKIF